VTALNAQRLIAASNRSDIPVYIGSRYPIGETTPLPSSGFHGADGLGDVPWAEGEEEALPGPADLSAAEFIARSARVYAGELVLLSFSPLVDVALACLLEPELPRYLRRLVAMGGAVYAPGNAMPLAEANFLHDAAAARLVLARFATEPPTPSPMVLAPLDVTMRALATAEEIREIGKLGAGCKLFERACATYQRSYCEKQGMCESIVLHDSHTVAWLLEPSLYSSEEMALTVVVGGDANGMSYFDRRAGAAEGKPTVTVLLGVDSEGFMRLMMKDLRRLGGNMTQKDEL